MKAVGTSRIAKEPASVNAVRPADDASGGAGWPPKSATARPCAARMAQGTARAPSPIPSSRKPYRRMGRVVRSTQRRDTAAPTASPPM